MTTSALRKRVHEYIDQVDDGFLTIVHQLLEHEINGQEIELSDEDTRIVNKRRAEMRSGKVKGIPHKKMMSKLRAHLKKTTSK